MLSGVVLVSQSLLRCFFINAIFTRYQILITIPNLTDVSTGRKQHFLWYQRYAVQMIERPSHRDIVERVNFRSR